MVSTKGAGRARPKDLQGIRQRGGTFQVRVYGGRDPVTGRQVILTGSAAGEKDAIRLRDQFRGEVAQRKSARTTASVAYLVREWLDQHDADPDTVRDYRELAESFIIPALGDLSLTKLAKLGPLPIERFYKELRRCRRRCTGRPFVEHRKGCRLGRDPDFRCDKRCKPHACRPLGGSRMRHIHVILNGSFKAAVRWRWLGVNLMDGVPRPRAPEPEPDPPSPAEAAQILDKAWSMDADWGTFVWLTMTTGARRGELAALRFDRVQLTCPDCSTHIDWHDENCPRCGVELLNVVVSTLTIRTGRRGNKEKDTKTHQRRHISLDPITTAIVITHHRRYEERVRTLGRESIDDAYIFSYAADHSRPCHPDGLTHKYRRMVAALGLDTHIHALRHYSATELLAGGADLRTVAGRLGHGAGGVTTLRVYAAWVKSADEQAAALLAARLPRPDPAGLTD